MRLAVPLARRTARLADLGATNGAASSHASAVAVPAAAREAAAAALDRGETHYTDRPGIAPLREAVAKRLGDRHALTISAGEVVVTCGVTEARFVVIQRLLPSGAGTVVALAEPDRVEGPCVVRDVALVGPGAATPDGPVLLYVPSGVTDEVRDPWFDRARAGDWPIVFEDEGTGASHPAAAGLADRTVTIGDLTAQHGAEAWRIGFLAAPSVTIGPLRDFKQALTICTTNVSQWGALALMEDEA